MTSDPTLGGEFVTFRLDGQLLGIPVLAVQDVMRLGVVTRVPRAPDMVAGVMNLRGRIVTAVDVRRCLAMPQRDTTRTAMAVVVEHGGQPYALIVDSVGDVVSVPIDRYEPHPATLSAVWRSVTTGVYRLEELMLILDIDRLLSAGIVAAA